MRGEGGGRRYKYSVALIIAHKKMEVRTYLTWEEDIFQTKSTHMFIYLFIFELLKT